MKTIRVLMLVCVGVFASGCGGGGSSGGTTPPPASNPPPPTTPPPTTPPPTTTPPVSPSPDDVASGFVTIPESDWDTTAVSKVLHAFAYGGMATPLQIDTWAEMAPAQAIVQILSFDEHNLKLAPIADDNTDGFDSRAGSLGALAELLPSDDPTNPAQAGLRGIYEFPSLVWGRAVLSRGLNPFRQKIGFWETNDHMAVNLLAGVTRDQLTVFYDTVMDSLGDGDAYDTVIGNGALTAAVAFQYGYYANFYVNGQCLCNEDFARELHQLYFGILGEYNPEYHESVTIKNTAAALTDVQLSFDPVELELGPEVTIGTQFHPTGTLDILNVAVPGQDARERMDTLVDIAIEHPESLDNLPVRIVRVLADDALDESKIAELRSVWRAMPEKNLLAFLRAYAISTQFHSADRVKYLTSVERLMLLANRATHSNAEGYTEIYTPFDLETEGVIPFAPTHNVFGSQTGLEAAASASVFRNNHNRVTADAWRHRLSTLDDNGIVIDKRWDRLIPASATDNYRVDRLAEWLWQHYLADGMKNYGALERAHLHAILARDRDLVFVVERERVRSEGGDADDLALLDFDRVISFDEVGNGGTHQMLIDALGAERIALNSTNDNVRHEANSRVGQAINFIAATPFIFAQEGR